MLHIFSCYKTLQLSIISTALLLTLFCVPSLFASVGHSKVSVNNNYSVGNFNHTDNGEIAASTTDSGLTLKTDSSTVSFSKGENWFGLELVGYGRGETINEVNAPKFIPDGSKLEMEYENLTQWYVNHGSSFEHGVILNSKPDGTGKLVFLFATSGNLLPQMKNKDILFTGENSIEYASIKAWDADGRILVCSMSLDNGQLLWSVDDTVAVYPITIDPTVSEATALTVSDLSASDYFGESVAVSEDTILVGAYKQSVEGKEGAGAVYVFSKDEGGTDNWGLSQKLTAATPLELGYFGKSVAISSNIAVVGGSCPNQSGYAYVFTKDSSGKWVADSRYGTDGKITPPDADTSVSGHGNIRFGNSVAISGETIVIGAPRFSETSDTNCVGKVYICEPHNSVLSTISYYEDYRIGARSSSQFGYSVAIYQDTILVGANGMDDDAGSVYVFQKKDGTWERTKLTTPDGASFFGSSVAISGDVIIGGSPGWTTASGDTTMGNAYIYSLNEVISGNTASTQTLKPQMDDGSDDTDAVHFSEGLAISGDKIVVGAPGKDSDAAYPGAAYIFSKETDADGANWTIVKRVYPSNNDASDINNDLGTSVALFEGMAVVGEPHPSTSSGYNTGAVFYCTITDDTPEPDKIVVPVNDQPSGTSVTIDEIEIKVRTTDELKSQYQNVGMDSMLGSQIYNFTATVTANQLAYFAFNSTSLGERRAGDVKLYKLFSDKNSLQYTYSSDKTPAAEGYFWVTDEANSGQYIDPNTILVGGRSYTINFSILDNGEYDANSTAGTITDPVAPGVGSNGESGCVLNPDADFSIEWFLLGISIILLLFRSRFKRKS